MSETLENSFQTESEISLEVDGESISGLRTKMDIDLSTSVPTIVMVSKSGENQWPPNHFSVYYDSAFFIVKARNNCALGDYTEGASRIFISDPLLNTFYLELYSKDEHSTENATVTVGEEQPEGTSGT